MLKRCVYGKVGFWDFIVGRAIILEVCRGKTVRFFSQVNDQIVTVELPEALVKEYWEKTPDFQTFVEEFRVRNPLAKDLQKKAPPAAKAAAATKSVLPRKRPATKDVSGSMVALSDAPGSAKLVEVPIINARLATKSDTMPILVISDAGAYILNNTGSSVTWMYYKRQALCQPLHPH